MLGTQHMRRQDTTPIYLINEQKEKVKKRYCNVLNGEQVAHVQRMLGLERRQYQASVEMNGDSSGFDEGKIVELLGVQYIIDQTTEMKDQRMADTRKDYAAFPSTKILMLIRG